MHQDLHALHSGGGGSINAVVMHNQAEACINMHLLI
jgi:hypothetical protein